MRFLGGVRDGQEWYWDVTTNAGDLPELEAITAVVGIMKSESRYLAIQNARGWDIPGGHREVYETCEDALRREFFEEAQVLLGEVKPVICLTSTFEGYKPTYIILYAGQILELQKFIPTEEISGRMLFTKEELISNYFGNQDMLTYIISLLSDQI